MTSSLIRYLQYDMNSGEITQEYDQHLGPVNSITWVDENRRFITTSDDKSIRAWDYDIPVVIKYIAEPHMHSMPAVTLHPSSKSTSHSFAHALVIIIYCRKILCRTKSGQPNPHLQRGQLPTEPEETVCGPLRCRLCMSDWVLARWQVRHTTIRPVPHQSHLTRSISFFILGGFPVETVTAMSSSGTTRRGESSRD